MSDDEQTEEEFKRVIYKKSRLKWKVIREDSVTEHRKEDYDFEVDLFMKRLGCCRKELINSKYLKTLVEMFKSLPNTYENILCLGIGNFSINPTPLHQFALVIELKAALNSKNAMIFDPVVSEQEKAVMRTLDIIPLEQNLVGGHVVGQEGVLAFFPHCPFQLSENYLIANWSPEKLAKTVLFCNSFDFIVLNQLESTLKAKAVHILKIVEKTEIKPVPNNYQYSDVFNDMAIHSFLEKNLPDKNDKFWQM